MEATTSAGGITTVQCPECDSEVTVSLPRDAEILSLTTTPETAPDRGESGATRTRTVEMPCSKDHPVTVFFDW